MNYSLSILQYTDYYPYGMLMPGRHGEADNASYRYGFNGMEKDDEVKGSGNSYDFGARMQDPRLGRFLSVDAKGESYPGESNYSYAGNNPIFYIDENGDIKIVVVFLNTKEDKNGKVISHENNDFVKNSNALKKKGYVVLTVVSGKDMLNQLSEKSSVDDPIEDLVIYSHGIEGALIGPQKPYVLKGENLKGDNGFYTVEQFNDNAAFFDLSSEPMDPDNDGIAHDITPREYIAKMIENGAATERDLVNSINSGDIVFDENIESIKLLGCNGALQYTFRASTAGAVAKVTQIPVVAAVGKTTANETSGATRRTGGPEEKSGQMSDFVEVSPSGKRKSVSTEKKNDYHKYYNPEK